MNQVAEILVLYNNFIIKEEQVYPTPQAIFQMMLDMLEKVGYPGVEPEELVTPMQHILDKNRMLLIGIKLIFKTKADKSPSFLEQSHKVNTLLIRYYLMLESSTYI